MKKKSFFGPIFRPNKFLVAARREWRKTNRATKKANGRLRKSGSKFRWIT